jgi:predicted transcriptional regulator
MWEDLNQIKKMRQRLGLTQKELAVLSGVSQSLIAKIEKEKIEPSYSVVKKIFMALDSKTSENSDKICAEDLCTCNIIYVSAEETIEKVIFLMKEYAISQVPVIGNNEVIGSITESSLINNYDKIGKFTKVQEIMDVPFPVIPHNAPVTVVKELLLIYPAIVVMKNGEKKGIITKADLLKKKTNENR